MKHESWLKKCLQLRKPKNQQEYKYKIVAALLITSFVFLFRPFFIDITSGEAYGTYNPVTDTIWIKSDLEGRDREIVVTHEETHQAFYRTLPFFCYLEMPSLIFFIFLLILGALVYDRQMWFLASLVLLILYISEIHAYGYTLLIYGIDDLTLGLFKYLSFPLLIFVIAKWVLFRPHVPKPRIIGYTRFRKAERKGVTFYFLGLSLILFCWGVVLGYIIFGNGDFSFLFLFVILMLVLAEVLVLKGWVKLRIGLAKRKVRKR